jgi:hypothetical protein
MSQQNKPAAGGEPQSGASRRGFLTGLGGAGLLATLQAPSAFADDSTERQHRAYVIRRDAALFQRDRNEQPSIANSDEQLYPNRIASFTKALPHNDLGEVDLNAYDAMTRALSSGLASDFEAIPLGGTVKLANPQAAYCFSMEGADAQAISIAPAPAFNSAQMAAEMAEDYWYALTRDVPFSQYSSDPLINQAAADLSKFSDYRAPKVNGQVTPAVIFRGDTPGDVNGPYISQFLLKPVPLGGAQFAQLYRTSVAGDDYMTNYTEWLKVQRGVAAGSNVFESTPRYIRNTRDLAPQIVHTVVGHHLRLARDTGSCFAGSRHRLARRFLPEMDGASTDSPRGIRRADSQSRYRSGPISHPLRYSELGCPEGALQRPHKLSLADALSAGMPSASVVSRGTHCDWGRRRHHAQGAL